MRTEAMTMNRLDLKLLGLWFLALIAVPATAVELTATRQSPHAKVQAVELDEVRWTEGFWADRFATCRDHSVPAMWKLMKGTEYKPFLQHFLIAAGEAEGDYHGAAWNDGDFYKWIEAASAVWSQTHDPKLQAALEMSVRAVAKAQRPDGYLHTPVLIRQRHGDASAQPFQDRQQFEMYNMGHLLTAACVYYRATGQDDLLKVAEKAAEFLEGAFRDPTPDLAKNSVCPSHYMGIIELYRTTRNPRYLDLARRFLTMRNLVTEGSDDNQDRVPFVDQREAVGHAVRANYLYAGAADLFAETGDNELWNALNAIWENVVGQKMYVTGACGALFDGASPDGAINQSTISRVHQAYGRNYQLPNITAHNETCAAIGNVLWNWRMFLVTGEARYVDIMERALYNGVLSGVSLTGTEYFYVNPLRQVEPLPTELRWSRTRVPFIVSFCCPPNVVRTIAEVGGYAYGKTPDAIWVNLYGSNTLSTTYPGGRLQLQQTTAYPWEGGIQFVIREVPAGEFAMRLRVPGWAPSATVFLNGDVLSKPDSGTYCEIRRLWKVGDVVKLHLEMPVQLMEAHPLVEETRQQVALQRGPVVYCLESPDLPPGVRLHDVVVPSASELVPVYRADLLHGVTAIDANVLARMTDDWSGQLYRPRREDAREVHVRFIPYYAWSNRGPSEMSVWLPVR